MKKALILATVAMAASGCMKINYNNPGAGSPEAFTHKSYSHSLLWGLMPGPATDLSICGEAGVHHMSSQYNFMTWLATGVTGGIWTPWRIKVTCAQGGSTSLEDIEVDTVTEG